MASSFCHVVGRSKGFAQLPVALGAWFLLAGATLAADRPEVLLGGTAQRDITPAKPVALAGYGGRKGLSQGIHDPLSARVVAFQRDGKRLVLVSVDVVGFYHGADKLLREAVLTACGLEPAELFLAAIHTHSAPLVTYGDAMPGLGGGDKTNPNNVEYTNTLQSQLVAAVREALGRMAPVEIAFGSGSSPVGAIRREPVRDAAGNVKIVFGRNPSVMTDREVQVLRVTRTEGGVRMAVIFAYATHSTSLGGENYLVSGDVHGLAEQFVEKQLDGVLAPGFAGASGDIDPWFRVLPGFKTDKGWIPEPVLLGTMLGQEVVGTLNRMKKPVPAGPIKTCFKTLVLPPNPHAKSKPDKDGKPPEFNITVGRLGDVAVVGLGGEVFNDIGKAIKTASPFTHTLVITHCNGAAGYLPVPEAYAQGGYEVQISHFGPDAAQAVIAETLRMLREL